MNRYIFGLSNYITRQWIEKQWKKHSDKNLDKFINKLMTDKYDYLLPLISGDKKLLHLMRKRYFQYLCQVISQNEIRDTLKLEIKLLIKKVNT